jgi:hypothetical protein
MLHQEESGNVLYMRRISSKTTHQRLHDGFAFQGLRRTIWTAKVCRQISRFYSGKPNSASRAPARLFEKGCFVVRKISKIWKNISKMPLF